MRKISAFVYWFLNRSLFTKIFLITAVIGIGWYSWSRVRGQSSTQPQYQTAQVERGTLVVSVTASGQVSAVTSASVTTESSGVVTAVYIKDSNRVHVGDKIAEIELDLEGKQRSSQAFAGYQNAKNTVDIANVRLYTLQADMFDKWDTFKELAEGDTYKDPTSANRNLPEFHIPQKEWLASEATYKNQQSVIGQAQTALNAAWLSYQQASPVIYAPISGTITGLSLQKGTVITTQRASTTNTATAQKIASIKTDAPPSISINLTEIDVPKVTIGNQATVTFDALSGKTYTGNVVSVDSVGTVSSGVTTYPTVIALDVPSPDILPNMAASASIITQTKDNVLLVPSGAVQRQNGSSGVRIMSGGRITETPVEIGLSSDTQVEIISGLSEDDIVITGSSLSSATNGSQNRTQSQSPFSPFGGRGFGGGVRIR